MTTVQQRSATHIAPSGAVGVAAPLSIIGAHRRTDASVAAAGGGLADPPAGTLLSEHETPHAGDQRVVAGRPVLRAQR
jgi:hypothetical protein